MKRFIFSMATVAALLTGGNAAMAQTGRWDAYLELEGRAGDREERSQSRTFIPLFTDSDSLLFGDIRMMYNDRDEWEGNFGVGYRKITGSQRIFGAYGFYDIRDTDHDNVFHQATVGAELLDINWGLRSNVYLPDTSSQRAYGANAFLQGNQILIQGNQERAYRGVDVEAEHILWRDDYSGQSIPGIGGDMEIWAAGGYFHFDNSASGFQHISGPRARVEARLYDLPALGNDSRVVLSGQYEYDDVRGSVSQGFLSVRIPLGGSSCKSCKLGLLDRRMVTPIVRDIDIITNVAQAGNIYQGVNAKTGTILADVVTLTAADNVRNMIEAGPNGRTFILDGVDGPFVFGGGGNGDIDLNNQQILIGGGGSMNVVGAGSNLDAVFTAPGEAFTFDRINNNGSVITMARNNGIYGLTLNGGSDSIFGNNNLGTFEIAGNTLMNASGDLIDLRASGGTTIGCIINNRFLSNGDEAIEIDAVDDADFDISIIGNVFEMTNSDGIILDLDDNSTFFVDVRNNKFMGQGNDGFEVDIDDNASLIANISNNVFDDVDDEAIEIDADGNAFMDVMIAGNRILGRGNTSDGIDIDLDDDSILNLVVHHNIFDDVTSDAFEVDADERSELYLDFHGNSIFGRGNTNDGVDIDMNNNTFLEAIIEDNLFNDISDDAIHIDGNNNADLIVDILDNKFRKVMNGNIEVHANGNSFLDVIINNNNIKGGVEGIDVFAGVDGDHFATIGGNKVRKITGTGINVDALDTLFLDDAGMNNKVTVEGGGVVSDIDGDGDVIGTIRINGTDITVP